MIFFNTFNLFFHFIKFILIFLLLDGIENTEISFINSPWSTPCLVLKNFLYNCHSRKNGKEYWRCHNYSKKQVDQRCRARCVIENGKLKSCSGGFHNHLPHTDKINKMVNKSQLLLTTVHRKNSTDRLKKEIDSSFTDDNLEIGNEFEEDSPVYE